MHRFEDLGPELYSALLSQALAAESLAADLRTLASGHQLSAAVLADAPIFERYLFTPRTTVVCMGVLSHPGGEEGALSNTDEVIVDARKDGWIRTSSGLYRLGAEVLRQSYQFPTR